MHAFSNPKAKEALGKLLAIKVLLRNMATQLVVLLEIQHFCVAGGKPTVLVSPGGPCTAEEETSWYVSGAVYEYCGRVI